MTMKKYGFLVDQNPYISKVIYYEELKGTTHSYDLIIDLHKNPRTTALRTKIKGEWVTYNKKNISKWLLTAFKVDVMKQGEHLVERYFDALAHLDISYDHQGLDYFGEKEPSIELPSSYHVINCGGTYFTKRIPYEKVLEIIEISELPCVLVGGQDAEDRLQILSNSDKVVNLISQLSFHESSYVIKHSALVWTSDSGLMHVAAAFNKDINVLWGSTDPRFGMFPLVPKLEDARVTNYQVELSCRPCSKIGFDECPKRHFKCMKDQVILAPYNDC